MNKKNTDSFDNSFEWYLDHPWIPWGAPDIYLVKDLKHKLVAANSVFESYSGFSARSLVGLSDIDMPWAENRDIYINHENYILAGSHCSVVEPLYGIKKINIHTTKNIIYSRSGVVKGTLAVASILKGDFEYSHLAGKETRLNLSGYPGYSLTPAESNVLFYLLRLAGHKAHRKEISERLHISTGTYDTHLKSLKVKFGVNSTNDLVFICYQKGFQKLMPNFILL